MIYQCYEKQFIFYVRETRDNCNSGYEFSSLTDCFALLQKLYANWKCWKHFVLDLLPVWFWIVFACNIKVGFVLNNCNFDNNVW